MTVAHTLSVISYHIIANPDILSKLRDELACSLPTDGPPPNWGKLEQLPYLVRTFPPVERSAAFMRLQMHEIERGHPRRLKVGPPALSYL